MNVTVNASDNNLHAQAYSFDDGATWQAENSLSFSENQSVQIKVRDMAGNISSMGIVIDNIDKQVLTGSLTYESGQYSISPIVVSAKLNKTG